VIKTAKQVFDEFVKTPIGKPIHYYRGFLMKDAADEPGIKAATVNEAERLRDMIWDMYEEGRVLLTQKRVSHAVYEKRTIKVEGKPDVEKDFCVQEGVWDYFMTKRERARV
jgi:hypothetical protein